MEMQIFLFGIALPALVSIAFSAFQNVRARTRNGNLFFGVALSITLFLSAISEDSIVNFTSQNLWLWFPLAVLLSATLAVVGNIFAHWFNAQSIIACLSTIGAALLLNIPGWGSMTNRLLLGIAVAACAILLLVVVQRRKSFSTPMALSFALIAPSALAMISGFAKLAVPLGAVSCCLGFVSLIRLATRSGAPNNDCVGFGGAVVVATMAALGAATGFAYDTNAVPTVSWLLAAIAPLGLWLGEAPVIRARPVLSAWARILGCVILTIACVVIALLALNSPDFPITE